MRLLLGAGKRLLASWKARSKGTLDGVRLVALRRRVLKSESRPVLLCRLRACSSAVSLRARTGVLASSFILEAGGFDSPLAYPSGPNYSAHCAASKTSLVRAAALEPPFAHAPLPH